MKNTNLIELLSYFKDSDIKSFSKFLVSPFFNSNKAAVSLFSEIKRYYPQFSSAGFTKSALYSSVFPGEKYNDTKMRKLISDLNKLAEKYISVERLTKDESQMYNSFLNFKKEKHIFKNTESNLNNWEKLLKHASVKKNESYYFSMLFFEGHVSHFNSFKPKVDHDYRRNELKSLICYFSLKAMQVYNINFILRLAFNTSNENFLMREILALDERDFFSDEPLIHVYCSLLRLFMTEAGDNTKQLQRVQTELEDIENYIDSGERTYLYWIITQYLVLTSHKSVSAEYSSLKWYYLKKQIGLQIEMGEKFSWASFVSIVNNGLAQNEFEWIGKFINDCSHLINYENKNLLISWAKAKMFFTRGDYVKSLKELLLIKSNPGHMKYNISSLTVMNYYELGHYNELSSYLQAYGKYISNTDKLYDIGISKKLGERFVKAVNLLVKFQYSRDTVEQMNINTKIEKLAENQILCRSWILEKLKEGNINK